MGDLELLGGAKSRNERAEGGMKDRYNSNRSAIIPMLPGDDDGASTSALAFLDQIYVREALSAVRSLQLLSEIVITDATSENDRVWGKAVLNSPVSVRDL
jgi:hypothetical protein